MIQIYEITGLPGSGKSTQGMLVAEKLGFQHIDIGDTLHEYLSTHPDFSTGMQSGPFPPQKMLKVLEQKFKSYPSAKGIILTHHYHTIEEFDKRIELFEKLGFDLKKIFALNISKEVAIERSLSRLNGNFNHKEPSVEKIIARIDKYHELSKAYKEHCDKLGLLVDINGEVPREEVLNKIIECLDLYWIN